MNEDRPSPDEPPPREGLAGPLPDDFRPFAARFQRASGAMDPMLVAARRQPPLGTAAAQRASSSAAAASAIRSLLPETQVAS